MCNDVKDDYFNHQKNHSVSELFLTFLKAYNESPEKTYSKLVMKNDPLYIIECSLQQFNNTSPSKARPSFDEAMKRTKEKHAEVIKKLGDN